jgi:hypothetical protein
MITSFDELVALLVADRVPHEASPAERSVRIPTRQRGVDGVQIIRWQPEDGVVQFIQSVAAGIDEARLPALADAIARLNHVLPVPGLDLGHAGGLVSYRVALPLLPRGKVEPDEIRACFRYAVRTGGALAATVARLAAGELRPEDAVADARNAVVPPTPHAAD